MSAKAKKGTMPTPLVAAVIADSARLIRAGYEQAERRRVLRQELITQVALSTGDMKTAEYVVNRLTLRDTDLLARAALMFANDELHEQGRLV